MEKILTITDSKFKSIKVIGGYKRQLYYIIEYQALDSPADHKYEINAPR